jgi:hypothetical protein
MSKAASIAAEVAATKLNASAGVIEHERKARDPEAGPKVKTGSGTRREGPLMDWAFGKLLETEHPLVCRGKRSRSPNPANGKSYGRGTGCMLQWMPSYFSEAVVAEAKAKMPLGARPRSPV